MNPLMYWVKFDKTPRPEKIVAENWEDFKIQLNNLVMRTGQPFEWLVREY
jgi:hypothetical protein